MQPSFLLPPLLLLLCPQAQADAPCVCSDECNDVEAGATAGVCDAATSKCDTSSKRDTSFVRSFV